MEVGKQRERICEEMTWWAVEMSIGFDVLCKKLNGGQLQIVCMWSACFKQCGT